MDGRLDLYRGGRVLSSLCNRRWGGSIYVLQMFFFVFLPSAKKYETAVLGNGWTDLHETFTKRYRGKWSLQRRAAAWRMANVDDLLWDNRSRECWTDFHETFTKWYRGKWSLQRRAAAWWMSCRRLANVDDLHKLRYDSGAITRGRHVRRLRYKIMSARMDLI